VADDALLAESPRFPATYKVKSAPTIWRCSIYLRHDPELPAAVKHSHRTLVTLMLPRSTEPVSGRATNSFVRLARLGFTAFGNGTLAPLALA